MNILHHITPIQAHFFDEYSIYLTRLWHFYWNYVLPNFWCSSDATLEALKENLWTNGGLQSGPSLYSTTLTCLRKHFCRIICSAMVVWEPFKLRFLLIKAMCVFFSQFSEKLCSTSWLESKILFVLPAWKDLQLYFIAAVHYCSSAVMYGIYAVLTINEKSIKVFRLKWNNAYCIIVLTNTSFVFCLTAVCLNCIMCNTCRERGFYFGYVIYVHMAGAAKCCYSFIHCYRVSYDFDLISCMCTQDERVA